MIRRKSFREKGLRHKKSHCNISIRGWRGERTGKSLRSAWVQEKQGDFYGTLWGTLQLTGLDSWRKSSFNLPTISLGTDIARSRVPSTSADNRHTWCWWLFSERSAINWLSPCFTAMQQRQRSAQGLQKRPDPSTGAEAISPTNGQMT